MYDATRPSTFDKLQYWLDMIKTTRSPEPNGIFIVGNKIDVGGQAINRSNINEFLEKNQLSKHYLISAREETGIDKLLEDITGCIDWSSLIKNIKPEVVSSIESILKIIRNEFKIIKTTKLLNKLMQELPNQDRLVLRAALDNFASQDLIQFGRNDIYIILDPVYIDKWIAELIRRAADNDGVLSHNAGLEGWQLKGEQFDILMDFLTVENVCFDMGNKKWLFPNVIHKGEPNLAELDDWARKILESSPTVENVNFKGPGDLIFSRILVILSREYGEPLFISNVAGIWTRGSGRSKTVIFIHFIPSPEGGLIRVRTGGEKCERMCDKTTEVIDAILETFKN
jgi:hypothetical protein